MTSVAISVDWLSPTKASHAFEGEIRAFEYRDRTLGHPGSPLLFVGSSSIRLWYTLPDKLLGHSTLNRGFGGSQMSDLLHFFPRVVTVYKPRLIFVYEGDNDIATGKTVEAVIEDYRTFLRQCHSQLPGVPVVILAVKPSPLRLALIHSQRELNRRLQDLAFTEADVQLLDTFAPLLDSSGGADPQFFLPDHLHLNTLGYRSWQTLVEEFVRRAAL